MVRAVKVCIRDKEGLEAVYWIKRRPRMILGWFTPDKLIAKTLGFKTQLPFHIHFRYPLDGDYHFSFKFKDALTGDEVYENVYCDRVTRKEITAAGRSKSISPRVEQYRGLFVLMPEHRTRRLDDYLNETGFFSFPTSALPIRDGIHIRKSKISDKDGPCVDDLVIDVTTLGTGTLNILAQLLGKGVSLAWPSENIHGRSATIQNFRTSCYWRFFILMQPLNAVDRGHFAHTPRPSPPHGGYVNQ